VSLQHASVKVSFAGKIMTMSAADAIVAIRNFVFQLILQPGVFWGATQPSKTGGPRSLRLATWLGNAMAPFATLQGPSEDYYPYDLNRFTMSNKDGHVARLYSRVFGPFYCPASKDQKDGDCDTVPDECDICPATYNPDQRDENRDGLGDDCPGIDPVTMQTPPAQQSTGCGVTQSPEPAGLRPKLIDSLAQSMAAFKSAYCTNSELLAVPMFLQWCKDGDGPSCNPADYASCANWSMQPTSIVVPPAQAGAPYNFTGVYQEVFGKVCDIGPNNKPVCKPDVLAAQSWCTGLADQEVANAKAWVPAQWHAMVTRNTAQVAQIATPPGKPAPKNGNFWECRVTIREPLPQKTKAYECGCAGTKEN
jgi:hypothetical protein